MTAKRVRCVNCRFCDKSGDWCRIKALRISPQSLRSCKVYAKKSKAVS